MRDMSHVGTQDGRITGETLRGTGKTEIAYQDPNRYAPGQIKAEPYNPSQLWSDYALDQAEWRLSVGLGTDADRAALAHQRPPEAH